MARGNPYLLAVGAVALGVAGRWVVDPPLQDTRLPFFTFFPSVFFAAWIGGARPAPADDPRQPTEPVLQKPVAAAVLQEAFADALHRARWRVPPQP